MEEKKLEELTINELKELAESEGIELTSTKKTDIIEEINKAREVVTTDNTEDNQDDTDNASDEMSNEDSANNENNSNDEADTDSTDKEMPEEYTDKGKKERSDEVNKEIKEGWAVTQESDGKVHVRPTENGKIIDTPVEKVIKADGTIEDIEIPKGFVKKSNLNKKEYGYHNGRKYKKMKNGYGMWADNGQSFLLSELK